MGAPQAHNGQGAVFIYSGAEHHLFSTKPMQEIHADALRLPKVDTDFTSKPKKLPDTLRNFGASLSGGVDLDDNHYGELAVGAFGSDAIVLFRTRPVVDVELGHTLLQQYIKIDNQRSCPTNARTWYERVYNWEPHNLTAYIFISAWYFRFYGFENYKPFVEYFDSFERILQL